MGLGSVRHLLRVLVRSGAIGPHWRDPGGAGPYHPELRGEFEEPVQLLVGGAAMQRVSDGKGGLGRWHEGSSRPLLSNAVFEVGAQCCVHRVVGVCRCRFAQVGCPRLCHWNQSRPPEAQTWRDGMCDVSVIPYDVEFCDVVGHESWECESIAPWGGSVGAFKHEGMWA